MEKTANTMHKKKLNTFVAEAPAALLLRLAKAWSEYVIFCVKLTEVPKPKTFTDILPSEASVEFRV